jgi:hypothetical protein
MRTDLENSCMKFDYFYPNFISNMDATLKYSLIEKLVNTEDDAVLNQVKEFLEMEKNHWDTLNPKLKESIETSLTQIEKKNYISHEQVLKNIRETGRA